MQHQVAFKTDGAMGAATATPSFFFQAKDGQPAFLHPLELRCLLEENQGAPWRLAEVAATLTGQPAPDVPSISAYLNMVLQHYEETLEFYGQTLGGRVIRKHLGWYMDRAGTPADLRRAVLTEAAPRRLRALLGDALADHRLAA